MNLISLFLLFLCISLSFSSNEFLRDLESLEDVKNEIVWAVHEEFLNSSYLHELQYEELLNADIDDPIYNQQFYYIPIIPPQEIIDYRKSLPPSYIRFLPTSRLATIDQGMTAARLVRQNYSVSNISYKRAHPSLHYFKCLEYLGFSTHGPYWPTIYPKETTFSYKEKSTPIKANLYMSKTRLNYTLLNEEAFMHENEDIKVPYSNEFEEIQTILNNNPQTSLSNNLNIHHSKFRHAVDFFEKTRTKYYRGNYLVWAKYGIITITGSVMFDNDTYIGEDSCLSLKENTESHFDFLYGYLRKKNISIKYLHSIDNVITSKKYYRDYTSISYNSWPNYQRATDFKRVDKVFLLDALWDHNYYHILVDLLPRVTYYLDFLRKNPDIKIHIYKFDFYKFHPSLGPNFSKIRKKILKFIKINYNRVVFGEVIAKHIFIPRPTRCYFSVSNPYELLNVRSQIIESVIENLAIHPSVLKKSNFLTGLNNLTDVLNINHPIIMAIRDKKFFFKNYQYYNNKVFEVSRNQKEEDKIILISQRYRDVTSERNWNDQTFNLLVNSFKTFFPKYKIILTNDKGKYDSIDNISSDVLNYARADIIVSSHGASQTNIMFAKENTLIVEINGRGVDNILPVCGYFTNLGAVFSHHHLSYIHRFHSNDTVDFNYIARETLLYYSSLMTRNTNISNTKKLEFDSNFNHSYPFLYYKINNVKHFEV